MTTPHTQTRDFHVRKEGEAEVSLETFGLLVDGVDESKLPEDEHVYYWLDQGEWDAACRGERVQIGDGVVNPVTL